MNIDIPEVDEIFALAVVLWVFGLESLHFLVQFVGDGGHVLAGVRLAGNKELGLGAQVREHCEKLKTRKTHEIATSSLLKLMIWRFTLSTP